MDAATLRIILLVIGIAFLIALFWWETHRAPRADATRKPVARASQASKREPNLGLGNREASPNAGTHRDGRDRGQSDERPATGHQVSDAFQDAYRDAPAPEDDAAHDSPDEDLAPFSDQAEANWPSSQTGSQTSSQTGSQTSSQTGSQTSSQTARFRPRSRNKNRHAPRDEAPDDQDVEEHDDQPLGDVDPDDLVGLLTDTDAGPIVQVFLVARDAELTGDDILTAASRHLLIAGDKDIFHRFDGDPKHPRTLFSMANLVQPGSFPLTPDPASGMADFTTRGIALFTGLHGRSQDIEAVDTMLTTAKSLARELHAEVEDAEHRSISVKRIESLRGHVIHHAHAGRDRVARG